MITQLQQILPITLENQPVQLAYLYGSTVSGYATNFSDVDIALVAQFPMEPLVRLKLIQHVQQEL